MPESTKSRTREDLLKLLVADPKLTEAAITKAAGKLLDSDGNLNAEAVEKATRKPLGFRYSLAFGKGMPGLHLRTGADAGPGAWVLAYRPTKGGKKVAFTLPVPAGARPQVALDAARAFLTDVRRGADPAVARREERLAVKAAAAKLTLREYLDDGAEGATAGRYWREHLSHQRSGASDRRRVLAVFADLLDRPLDEIDAASIDEILWTRRRAGIEPGTVRRDWGTFRAILREAARTGIIEKLPVNGEPTAIRDWKPEDRLVYVRALEDARLRLLDKLREMQRDVQDEDRLILTVALLMCHTGMRRSEIMSMRAHEITSEGYSLPAARTKTNKARLVVLSAAARAALSIWKLRDAKTGELFPGFRDADGREGPEYQRWADRLRADWARVTAAADAKEIWLRDLRHVHATSMLRAGASLPQVQRSLGHKSISSTMIYAETEDREVLAVASRLEF